jgi:hypothetical protein
MTKATTWHWKVLPQSPSPYMPLSSDLRINTSIPLLSEEEILFRCEDCHTPITLQPIPIVGKAILCPDCFAKQTGILLNFAAAKTGVFLREITI